MKLGHLAVLPFRGGTARNLRCAALAVGLALTVSCAGRPGSIGAVLAQGSSNGRVTVREAPPGYPASRAGIEPGDEILLIEGRDVRSMTPEAIHQALEGDVGTQVKLTLLRRGKIERISLTRAALAPRAPR